MRCSRLPTGVFRPKAIAHHSPLLPDLAFDRSCALKAIR